MKELLRYEFTCDPEFRVFEETMTIGDGYLEACRKEHDLATWLLKE